MKKSEALQLIQDIFEFEGLGMQMRYKDACSILEALLDAGMMPPDRKNGLTFNYEWDPE